MDQPKPPKTQAANLSRQQQADEHALQVLKQLNDRVFSQQGINLEALFENGSERITGRKLKNLLNGLDITTRKGNSFTDASAQRLRERLTRLKGEDPFTLNAIKRQP